MNKKKIKRFWETAVQVAERNNCKPGDIIDAFNGKVNKTKISPCITTRPEGFKTAIIVVVRKWKK